MSSPSLAAADLLSGSGDPSVGVPLPPHSRSSLQDQVATTCTVASLLISCYQIAMHLINYNEPYIQLYILRILMMIPVFSVMTWLSIMRPTEALYFSTIRDIYEAYVLYMFMQLLIHFLGGENSLIVHLEFKRRIKQPWPLDGLKPLQTDKIFFRRVKQGVLQFVLIKPCTAILAIVLESYGVLHEGHFEWYSGYMYLSAINNTSVSLSLYCLVLFYMATEERLKPFSPFAKFLCIKAILFFSFWQACAFTVLLKMNLFDRESANVAQNLIISVEMVFAAIAQSLAFNYRPHMDGARNVKRNNTQIIQDLQSVPSAALRATGAVFKNMTYVLNVKDVLSDAHNTFMNVQAHQDEEDRQLDDILKRDKAFHWSDEEIKAGNSSTSPTKEEVVDHARQVSEPPRQRKPHHPKAPQKPMIQLPQRSSLGAIQTTPSTHLVKHKEQHHPQFTHSQTTIIHQRHSLPSKPVAPPMLASSLYHQVKTNVNQASAPKQQQKLQHEAVKHEDEYYDEEEDDDYEFEDDVENRSGFFDHADTASAEGDFDDSVFSIALDGARHSHHIKVASNIKEGAGGKSQQQKRVVQQSILQQV